MPGTDTPPNSDQKTRILKTIAGPATLPVVSQAYRNRLLVTAAAVLLLPILYLGMLLLLSMGLIAFCYHSSHLLSGMSLLFRWCTILVVISISGGLLLGMLKPLLVSSITPKRNRTVGREAEPFLYQYVEQLCDTLGTPHPARIHVTWEANAYAEFRQLCMNPFKKPEIALHVGLPLVAGLSLESFTGILAHELGHFAQSAAIRFERIIVRINFWFHQAVYEPDAIDDWLLSQSQGGFARTAFVPLRLTIRIARSVLLALVKIGQMISSQLSQQMELNADQYEVRTVGYQTMSRTIWNLRLLSLAHQYALRDIAAFSEEGRLPDDLIALVIANRSFITPKIRSRLRQMMSAETTDTLQSHPCDRERIQAACRDQTAGFFRTDLISDQLPATVLFQRFEELSKATTIEVYESLFKRAIKSSWLHPVEELLARQNHQVEAARALRRYFQTEVPSMRPLPIAAQSTQRPTNPQEAVQELKSCRQKMLDELPEYQRYAPRYRFAEDTLMQLTKAQALLDANIPIPPGKFRGASANSELLVANHRRARSGVANLAGKLLAFESEAGHRLSHALQLLQVPAVVRKIPDGEELFYEINRMLPEAIHVSHLMAELPSLRVVQSRLQALWDLVDHSQEELREGHSIATQAQGLRDRLVAVQQQLTDHLYPFDHAVADMTLREFVLPAIPSSSHLAELLAVTEQMCQRLVGIQARLFAHLASAAEKVEVAIGFSPLTEPVDPQID